MITKYGVIAGFILERFPHLSITQDDPEQIRINRKNVAQHLLVSVYDDAIYYICAPEHSDRYGMDVKLGFRWNGIWNKVPAHITHIDYFDLLLKSVNLALDNTKTHKQW